MNLGELRADLDRRTGRGFDTTSQNDALNAALRWVTRMRRWPWLITTATFTTDASAGYNLPTGWIDTKSVAADGVDLERVHLPDADQWANLQVWVNGAYTVNATQLVILPTSDTGSAIVHRYWQTEPALSDDADEPLLPARHHDLLVSRAALEQQARRPDADKTMLGVIRDDIDQGVKALMVDAYAGQARRPRQRRR